MRRSPHPIRCAVGGLVLASAVLLAPACTDDDDDPPTTDPPRTTPTTTSTSTSTTTTTPPTPEEQVKAALLEANAALYEAALTSDPEHPDLARTRSGPNLELVRRLLRERQGAGEIARYVDDTFPLPEIKTVELLVTDRASVTFCIVDNVQVVKKDGGAVVDDDVVSRLSRAEMQRVDGSWKLDSQVALGTWEDGSGCDR